MRVEASESRAKQYVRRALRAIANASDVAFGAPLGAVCRECGVSEASGVTLIAALGTPRRYLCVEHHRANKTRPDRSFMPLVVEAPTTYPEQGPLIYEETSPWERGEAKRQETRRVEAEERFARLPKPNVMRPGQITSEHKRWEEGLMARAPKPGERFAPLSAKKASIISDAKLVP